MKLKHHPGRSSVRRGPNSGVLLYDTVGTQKMDGLTDDQRLIVTKFHENVNHRYVCRKFRSSLHFDFINPRAASRPYKQEIRNVKPMNPSKYPHQDEHERTPSGYDTVLKISLIFMT